MCYHPLRIRNPARSYNFDSPAYLYVPCGHCPDCQRIQKNEWFFRSYFEFLRCKRSGGSVYFVTLTYDNEHLPTIRLPSCEIPCFNKFHVRNFVKYIRVFLKRKNYMSQQIKYLICCEYGKNNTKRPHYHGLLFFPFIFPKPHSPDMLSNGGNMVLSCAVL